MTFRGIFMFSSLHGLRSNMQGNAVSVRPRVTKMDNGNENM